MKPFSLLVKPASADCNLRCSYCFYLDRCLLYPQAVRHRMSNDVLERMISTFMQTEQGQYAIGWQGGEPTLMGLDFFKSVVRFQEAYGRRGAVVSNGLQTNGTLLNDAFAEHLARYNFLVGVSLDGPEAVHDHFRRTADGQGSHARVLQGIDALRRRGVEFNILTLVSRSNVGRPVETYRYLKERGVLFHQYIECVEFREDGELMPFAVSGREWGDFLCAVFDEWMRGDTRRVSVRLFDSVLTMLVDGYANVCHMGTDCRQYLVVEHNGDVYPCDFFVRPELKLGNVMENTWEELLASALYAEFGARKRQWNEACEACPYLRFCAGDCQKNRRLGGRDPRQLSHLCEGWKQFYAHALGGFERLADDVRRERQRAAQPQPPRPPVPPEPPGRNDPCPCGSGPKYKRCCGK